MLKIFIGTPHFNDCESDYAESLAVMIPAMPAQYHVKIFENSLLAVGRSDMFFLARDSDADYLLLIDTDQTFPRDALKQMIALKKDIVTGVYYQRVSPHRPVVYDSRPNGEVRNLTSIPNKPFRVNACGAGFMLISKKVLKAYTKEVALGPGLFEDKYFSQPFYHITTMIDGQPQQLAEDISFCHRMAKMGFQIWAEPSIRIGHVSRVKIYHEHFEYSLNQTLQDDKRADGHPDGWMRPEELAWLQQAASQCESVIEVGSWKGRSTKALLEGCKGTVTAIDHFKGTDDLADNTWVIGQAEPIYDIFMKNVGHYPNLKVLKMGSEEAAAAMNADMADMIFIDTDHRYEQVKAEIERWLPKCKKVMAIHDYDKGWPGVMKAVEEKFERFHVVGSIAFAEVKQSEVKHAA